MRSGVNVSPTTPRTPLTPILSGFINSLFSDSRPWDLRRRGPGPSDEERGRRGREGGTVRRLPSCRECAYLVVRYQRPHAAAEPRAKRRRGNRAQIPRRAREADRLGHLVAQLAFGQVLPPIDQRAESREFPSLQRLGRRRDNVDALLDELVEPVEQHLRGEAVDRRPFDDLAHRTRAATIDRFRQRRIEPPGGRAPCILDRAHRQRGAIVSILRGAGLLSIHAADGDDEAVIARAPHLAVSYTHL